jgi:hypothetical protein
MNNFMADGGDNYIEFKSGTNRLGGAVDIDALKPISAPMVARLRSLITTPSRA